ncbi:MAG: HIT domain-containing protein [Ignavibacteriae bacterium]|nr:HIT domain-containing protein [Ignavibacteria bacterium]MBI3364325.1 HIT domain-containing protein [Ignavibacteriota bacterium]
MQCEFCKIIRGDAAAEILFRNQRAIAILDINPIHYGHVLVMPNNHASTFLDVPDEELHDLISVTKVVTQAMVASLNPPGFNIFSNNGRAAGQSVFHCHFHITPRYDDDKIQFILKLKKYADDEMARYAERIRHYIDTNPIHEIH